MESIIINTTTQFYEIVESQNENMIYTRQELKYKEKKRILINAFLFFIQTHN